jgi:methylthioribulose-1-phosphate dehydratase
MKNIREQIAETIRAYHQKGWSPATSTNYSFREKEQVSSLFVSRSGIDKSQFQAADFIEVDLHGKPTPAFIDFKPSAETLIHCVLYQLFPETGVILHSHSIHSVLMSQKHPNEISFQGYEIQKGFEGQTTHEDTVCIPVFPNSQDMEEFTTWMIERKEALNNHCLVIQNHGAYAWGKTLFEAKRHLETLEYLLEVSWKSSLHSNF